MRIHPYVRVIYAMCGVGLSFSATLVWFKKYRQTWTIVMAALSAILAYWNLFAHIKNLQNTSRTRMESLRFLFITGVFFSLLAVVAFVTFLSIAIINKESLTNPLSFYMSSVWSVVSFKWAVLLVLTANHYRKEFNSIDILQDS